MSLLVLYLSTLIIFLGLDFIGLRYLVKPTFERDVAELLLDSPRYGPAFVFYAIYVGLLLWFVSWPALHSDRTLLWVLGSGALIGLVGYGTYEFTNLATLKGWSWRMVATDLTWGMVLTGVSAAAGVAITRAVASS